MKTQAWIDRKNHTGLVRCEVCGVWLPKPEMEWYDKRSQTGTCKRCASILTSQADTRNGGEE